MCLQCDGYSYEAVMQALDLQIRVQGWVLQHVHDDHTGASWSYTIGLVEQYGHPELTMLDVKLDQPNRVIRQLVDDIVTRGSVSPLTVLAEGLEIVDVHPDHLVGVLPVPRADGSSARPTRSAAATPRIAPPEPSPAPSSTATRCRSLSW